MNELPFSPPEDEYVRLMWKVEKLHRVIVDLRYIRPDVAKALEQDLFAAVGELRTVEAKREARRPSPERIKELRREIAQNYTALFDALVDRDGAHCANCRYTMKLVIDHIEPVVYGGTNELSNLRLLCPTCNSKKGAKPDELLAIETARRARLSPRDTQEE